MYKANGPWESLQLLYQDICRLVTLAYPSAEPSLVTHISMEAFIVALDNPKLQLDVIKGELSCVEAMPSHAIKVEAFEQCLACRGTGVANTVSGHSDHWQWNAYAVSDQKGADAAPALHKKADELQCMLTQATKGIVALVAGLENSGIFQPVPTDSANPV